MPRRDSDPTWREQDSFLPPSLKVPASRSYNKISSGSTASNGGGDSRDASTDYSNVPLSSMPLVSMSDSFRSGEMSLPSSGLPASDSLATHYIPDKLVSSPTFWGGEARKQSRKATGGLGAAAGRHMGSNSHISSANPYGSQRTTSGSLPHSPSLPGFTGEASTSAVSLSRHNRQLGDERSNDASLAHRARKQGAGRQAWGPNGGGHALIGGGGYESDEGLDISPGQEHDSLHDSEPKYKVRPTRLFGELHPTRSTNAHSADTPSGSSGEMSPEPKRPRSGFLARALGIELPYKRGKWNQFKWCLFAANFVLSCYAIAGFIAVLLVWANFFTRVNVLLKVNSTEIILSTVAVILCLATAIVGWIGILLNNRPFLAVYNLMLWICLAFIVAPGYIAYKRRTFNLSGKMNHLWSRELDLTGRRLVQTVLHCCGYYSPYIEAAADSNRCYARSQLPGCKGPLVDFEKQALLNIYAIAFALVAPHLCCIVVAMLCSGNITYRFGKGVTPERYRVNEEVIKHDYRKNAYELTLATQQRHLLFADASPLDSPRPPFWHEASSSNNSSKSKS